MEQEIYDVAVIGGGVVGGLTLRELARYQLKTVLLEKADDVVMGASKANSAIVHAGFDAEPGSLKAKFNVWGNRLMEETARELAVPFRRNGSLVLAFTAQDLTTVAELLKRGQENGVPDLALLTPEQVAQQEPNVTQELRGALWAPTGGIVCPYELAIGAVENAMDNGAELRTNFPVEKISWDGEVFTVHSGEQTIRARYLVNAAGVHADEVSRLIGDDSFSITPRRGEYLLLDKTQGATVFSTIFQPPTPMGKGVLVTPTVDGNLLIGPTSENLTDKEDVATTSEGIAAVQKLAVRSVPEVRLRAVITSFAGLRACADGHDFCIGSSPINAKFVQAAGIESPGLTASPAIAKALVGHLHEAGLALTPRADFNPRRAPFPKFHRMTEAEKNAKIQEDRRFGRIVCRCEGITEGEILAAIHRNPPARSVDAVKRRARAGMGRCQGGFCAPQVVEILSRELQIPMEDVTKAGGASRMLVGKTKAPRLFLKPLTAADGDEIYQLLQEIEMDDNGFYNPVKGMTLAEFRAWIAKEFQNDAGVDLEAWRVPQSSYWLYAGERPVGYGRIRHQLNDNLRENGGHIGYAIAASERGKGYGTALLRLLLDECRKRGIFEVQIGANAENVRSNRMILRSGGTLMREKDGKNFYILSLNRNETEARGE